MPSWSLKVLLTFPRPHYYRSDTREGRSRKVWKSMKGSAIQDMILNCKPTSWQEQFSCWFNQPCKYWVLYKVAGDSLQFVYLLLLQDLLVGRNRGYFTSRCLFEVSSLTFDPRDNRGWLKSIITQQPLSGYYSIYYSSYVTRASTSKIFSFIYFLYWFICNVTNTFQEGLASAFFNRCPITCDTENDKCESPDHWNSSFFYAELFQDKLQTLDN